MQKAEVSVPIAVSAHLPFSWLDSSALGVCNSLLSQRIEAHIEGSRKTPKHIVGWAMDLPSFDLANSARINWELRRNLLAGHVPLFAAPPDHAP
jgi:hypothetical protein